MNKDEIARKWRRLDPVPYEEIGKARDLVHEAIHVGGLNVFRRWLP